MAVRAFTVAHNLDCAVGTLTGTFGTYACIIKRGATGAWHTFMALHNAAGSTALNQFAYSPADVIIWWIDGITVTGPAAIGTADWSLLVARKATGTATPRFSLYNFTTDTWVHANASGARPNWSATGGLIRFNWQGGDNFVGRIAVRAGWNSLPWAASTAGDSALESAGLEVSAANWLAASPSAFWLFNQAAVTTPVADETGGGADQTSRTGTTVITDDDPPGFSFSLAGGTDVDLTDRPTALRLSGAGAVDTTIDTVINDRPMGLRLGGPTSVDVAVSVTLQDTPRGLRLGSPSEAVTALPSEPVDVTLTDQPVALRLGNPGQTIDASPPIAPPSVDITFTVHPTRVRTLVTIAPGRERELVTIAPGRSRAQAEAASETRRRQQAEAVTTTRDRKQIDIDEATRSGWEFGPTRSDWEFGETRVDRE